MALDFYEINDLKLKSRLFSLDENKYVDLEPIFMEFQKKTSIYVDPFGDTKIYINNVKLIIEIAEKFLINLDVNNDRLLLGRILDFVGKLSGIINGVLIVGD